MEKETIIKALEICANYKGCSDCKKCPLHNDEYVQCEQNVLEGLALALIKELTEECENYKSIAEYQQNCNMDRGFKIKRLTEENERLKKAKYIYATVDYCADDLAKALEENKRLTEENERLRAIPEQLHKEMSERMLEERKIERKLAVREMQERLKYTLCINNEENTEFFDYSYTLETIDEVANKILNNTEDEEK